VELLDGACYLIEDPKPNLSFRIVSELARRGTPGLCITRLHPGIARDRYRLDGVRVVWLSDAPGQDVVRPNPIVSLSKEIESFVHAHGDAVVLLDGVEYLISRNGFDSVLMFVEHLNEFFARTSATLLVPLSPETLDRKERARLERNLDVAEVDSWQSELDARDWSERLGARTPE